MGLIVRMLTSWAYPLAIDYYIFGGARKYEPCSLFGSKHNIYVMQLTKDFGGE